MIRLQNMVDFCSYTSMAISCAIGSVGAGILQYNGVDLFDKIGIPPILLGFLFSFIVYWVFQVVRLEIIRQLLSYREWMYDHQSFKTKAWGFLLSLLMPKRNKLFALQDLLPKYPLPNLKDTCERTLAMIKPLLGSAEEIVEVEKALNELEKNEGSNLQKILEKRYNTEDNWLSELWDKYVYLAGRKPIPVISNFILMGDAKFQIYTPVSHQLSQAANHIRYGMEYKEKIEDGSLDCMMIQNIVPICCNRYKYVCSTTRIPHEDIDELKRYERPKHVVVFRKGSIFKLDMYAMDTNGKESLLTPLEVQNELATIVKHADSLASASPEAIINPAIFTTADRKKWAEVRKSMQGNTDNARGLEVIESAAFCVSLDVDAPKDMSEAFHLYMTGNGFNRWFDKSLTMIFASNKEMGCNVEHTSAEATLCGRLWEYCYYYSKYDKNGDATHQDLPQHPSLPKLQLLKWELGQYEKDIINIKEKWEKTAADLDAHVYFTDKGKNFIKKLRVSPDGYIQMALQLAFYRIHKETPKTYETAATRLFKFGRTETIRSVSEESIAFTKSFDDPSCSREEKVEHLKAAIKYQTLYKFNAMNGRAVDRHLLGLYLAGKLSGSIPKLFTLKPFYEADRLSTSQSPRRYDARIISKTVNITDPIGGGFGAQRQDGYGISYFMDDQKVHFLIGSYHSCPDTSSAMFAQKVQQAIDDIKHLLEFPQSKTSGVKSEPICHGLKKNAGGYLS